MANFRECLVRGGRAYVDAGDVAAVIVAGDDFQAHASPDSPIRFVLSGHGSTLDIFGVSVSDLFMWLPAEKFQRLRMRGGHVFIQARHIVGLAMAGDNDAAPSDEKSPLKVYVRGVKTDLRGWGLSALDFLHWMRTAGREVKIHWLNEPVAP